MAELLSPVPMGISPDEGARRRTPNQGRYYDNAVANPRKPYIGNRALDLGSI